MKNLPNEGVKGREILNNFIKRVRSGQLSMDDLIGAICAYETVIYWEERVSPAWGGLLSNLCGQVEGKWRGEAFNTDIRSVQLVLLKRLFNDDKRVAGGNLVIWTAALKEMRMLSVQARELTVNWVLERCKREAEVSDWPVIFHNLILMSQDTLSLLTRVFEGICDCSSKSLMDHLIFLIGQNGRLGKSWIKWIMGRGCYGIDPLMFSGLLVLSQDIEYFHILNSFMVNMIKLMHEIHGITRKSIDPVEYLSKVAECIGSDSETGIKGALQLINSINSGLSEKFFIELYRKHPFARRELLKSLKYDTLLWKSVYEIDSIIFKEHFKAVNPEKLKVLIENCPELVSKVVENEDELQEAFDEVGNEKRLRVLIEIDSVLLNKALKNMKIDPERINNELSSGTVRIRNSHTVQIGDWREIVSIAQVLVLRTSVGDEEMTSKFVELCELLTVPGAIDEGIIRESLIELAIEFVIKADGIYSRREKILLISKLISTVKSSCDYFGFGGSYSQIISLFGDDLSSCEGTMKFLLERISEPSEEFYDLIKRIPLTVEFLNLATKAIQRIEKEKLELRESILFLISNVAGRVVSEPQLNKTLTVLLSKKYKKLNNEKLNILGKFTDISEPNMIKLVCEWGLEHEVEGIREEMMKSILMYYGIIETSGDGDPEANAGADAGDKEKGKGHSANNTGNKSNTTPTTAATTKFKNIHLNEKSVNFVLTILLNECQVNLETAHKLIKNYFQQFEENPNEFLNRWVLGIVENGLMGLTRALISGKGAIKLHSLLTSFYNLCRRILLASSLKKEYPEKLKELTRIVGGQLNKQVYALIPLQQEKIQTILKQDLNLKKSKGTASASTTTTSGKSVTALIYEMEMFEETLIGVLRERPTGEKGWCEKIVRSTARDFKIKLEQLEGNN